MNRNKTAVTEIGMESIVSKGLAGLHPGMWKKLPCNAECLITGIFIQSVKSGLVMKNREPAEHTITCTEQELN